MANFKELGRKIGNALEKPKRIFSYRSVSVPQTESIPNPERAQEFTLYQLVHEKERSVGMAKGDRRELEGGIVEDDTYAFFITRGEDGNLHLTGEVHTNRYREEQKGQCGRYPLN